MKWCSLVSASLENGWTDLANSVFEMFIMVQIRFLRKKNWKSCPENWKIREKLKVLFSMGTAGTMWLFFLNVRNNPNEVFIQAVPKREDESMTPLFVGGV
jgi:hypothetical protein